MNKHASYWKYTGNHIMGKDCERKDPHCFGVDLISYVAYVGDSGDYTAPLTYQDSLLIKVSHGKNDGLGELVTVSAPQQVWEKVKESYKNQTENAYSQKLS